MRADGTTEMGDWQHVTFAEAWQTARAIAQGPLSRGLSAERPVLILSDNSLQHALLALGCMVAGVPWAPVSPAYSLLSTDLAKLRHVWATLTPGLVFAQVARYARAVQTIVPAGCPWRATWRSMAFASAPSRQACSTLR